MFGTNALRKATFTPDELYVQEVFHTIQGEGPFTGMAAVFVRMWGCNLRCHFCDTDFESNKQTYTVFQLIAEIEKVRSKNTHLIVITGGEPMIQDLSILVQELVRLGFKIQVETAGTVWMGLFDPLLIEWVVSPKTPSINHAIARWTTHWKYIIGADDPGDPADGLPVMSTQILGQSAKLMRPPLGIPTTIWVQPRMDYRMVEVGVDLRRSRAELAREMPKPDTDRNEKNIKRCVDLVLKYGYRMSLQTHKILQVP